MRWDIHVAFESEPGKTIANVAGWSIGFGVWVLVMMVMTLHILYTSHLTGT